MVKDSGAAVKSDSPAAPAATDTGTWRGVARIGSPGNTAPRTAPGRKAVTVTSVVREAAPEPLSSLIRYGSTDKLMRWSSSAITTETTVVSKSGGAAHFSSKRAAADISKNSNPSAKSSPTSVTSTEPETVRVFAGSVTSHQPAVVKSVPKKAVPLVADKMILNSSVNGVTPDSKPTWYDN